MWEWSAKRSAPVFFMDWINPPEGYFTREKFLEMWEHYADVHSLNRNLLNAPTDPTTHKYFGNRKITVINENLIRLEAIT